MSFEAIDALAQAADVALRADGNLAIALGGAHVFSQEQPEDLQLDDYLVLATKDSGPPWLRFGTGDGIQGRGERLAITINCWSRLQRLDGTLYFGDQRVLQLAAHVCRILKYAQLALPSYGIVAYSDLFLQGSGAEPSGVRAKAVVRYEATCRRVNP